MSYGFHELFKNIVAPQGSVFQIIQCLWGLLFVGSMEISQTLELFVFVVV